MISNTEIVQGLLANDNQITFDLFFYEGPSLKRIDEIRRKDPLKAAKMRKPICDSIRPTLLKVMHIFYPQGFDYQTLAQEFCYYLLEKNVLAKINNPETVYKYLTTAAERYFLDKIKKTKLELDFEQVPEQEPETSISKEYWNWFFNVVKSKMSSKYAELIEVKMNIDQWKGSEDKWKKQYAIEYRKEMAEKYGYPPANFDTELSRSQAQFKQKALEVANEMNINIEDFYV